MSVVESLAGGRSDFLCDVDSGTEKDALLTAEIDGFRVRWKNDGVAYPAIWAGFRKGSLPARPITTGRIYRSTHHLELDGREYLMKKDWHVETRLEKRLLYFLMGGATRYGRIIQFVNRAVRRGCRSAQEVFLVAEKMEGSTCVEAWLIADFVPGHAMSHDEAMANVDELTATVVDVHRHGLACHDIQSYNFVRTDRGPIIAIDVDVSSPLVLCQADDIWRMRRLFGATVPLEGGIGLRLAYWSLRARKYLRAMSRRLRGLSYEQFLFPRDGDESSGVWGKDAKKVGKR